MMNEIPSATINIAKNNIDQQNENIIMQPPLSKKTLANTDIPHINVEKVLEQNIAHLFSSIRVDLNENKKLTATEENELLEVLTQVIFLYSKEEQYQILLSIKNIIVQLKSLDNTYHLSEIKQLQYQECQDLNALFTKSAISIDIHSIISGKKIVLCLNNIALYEKNLYFTKRLPIEKEIVCYEDLLHKENISVTPFSNSRENQVSFGKIYQLNDCITYLDFNDFSYINGNKINKVEQLYLLESQINNAFSLDIYQDSVFNLLRHYFCFINPSKFINKIKNFCTQVITTISNKEKSIAQYQNQKLCNNFIQLLIHDKNLLHPLFKENQTIEKLFNNNIMCELIYLPYTSNSDITGGKCLIKIIDKDNYYKRLNAIEQEKDINNTFWSIEKQEPLANVVNNIDEKNLDNNSIISDDNNSIISDDNDSIISDDNNSIISDDNDSIIDDDNDSIIGDDNDSIIGDDNDSIIKEENEETNESLLNETPHDITTTDNIHL